MTDDGHDEAAAPLEYRTPPPRDAGAVREAVAGFLLGFGLIAMAAVWIAEVGEARRYATTTPSSQPIVRSHVGPVAVCAVIVVAAVCGFFGLRRMRPRATGYLGMLLGGGVAALCEGLCFAIQ